MGLPVAISIEPTTSCNLRCPQCPSGLRSFTRPTGFLEEKDFKNTLNELSDNLLYITFYFQGEPYLNINFLNMVTYASSKNIYTATSTNGHFLTSDVAKQTVLSGLDRLIISLDGTTQDVYQKYRIGGNIDKVIEGIKNVVSWKHKLKSKKPFVILQFLILKNNEHQINDMKHLGKELQVDKVAFKTAQVYDYKNGYDIIPDSSKYSRYKKVKGEFSSKNKYLNHCWRMWHSCIITWDQKIVPCCFDKDASHQMGDLAINKFEQIWQGEQYYQFRKKLLKSRKNIDICKNCSEGVKVWVQP